MKKSETDLTIDQLHEIFIQLGKDKVSVSKFEKRLEEVRHKWDEIKKAQPQVKTDVEPIQVRVGDGPHSVPWGGKDEASSFNWIRVSVGPWSHVREAVPTSLWNIMQANESDRIKKDIEKFASKVRLSPPVSNIKTCL